MGLEKAQAAVSVTHDELARAMRRSVESTRQPSTRQPAEPTYTGPCLFGACDTPNFQGITLNEWTAHNKEFHGDSQTIELWTQAVGPSASRPPKASEPNKAFIRGKGRPIHNPATDNIPSGKATRLQRPISDRYEFGGRRSNRGATPRAVNKLQLQLDTRPIHLDQLIAEVKGIYAGLVMVESKCIEVDSQQNALLESQNRPKLSNDHWQAMIALHRTLLHEHHDFLLASQHPAASRPLKRLAAKYSMPARLWRHGIHSFLELMRHRLPDSLDHMLTFLVHAYSMITILYENVTAFKETWIECLGDLGRYRMAIEDSDMHVRETWAMVSRDWYNKASDLTPATGRLYHHLGILSRPHILRQLFYYTKSLCTPIPFSSTRESIVTLFDPVLNPKSELYARAAEADLAFARAYACRFYSKPVDEFEGYVKTFMVTIDNHISTRSPGKWIASGYQIAIAHCCTLMNFGDGENEIVQEMRPAINDAGRGTSVGESAAAETDHPAGPAAEGKEREKLGQSQANSFVMKTHACMFQRAADGDTQVLAYVNVTLAFVWCLGKIPRLAQMLGQQLPWTEIAAALTVLATKGTAPVSDSSSGKGVKLDDFSAVRAKEFPRPEDNWKPRPVDSGLPILPRPLPEDYAMRALLGTEGYFPTDWFDDDAVDDEQKYLEVAGERTPERLERILWLGVRVAAVFDRFLSYVATNNTFSAIEEDAEMVDAE